MNGRGYAIKDQNAVHFITFAVVNGLIPACPDGQVFTRKEYAGMGGSGQEGKGLIDIDLI